MSRRKLTPSTVRPGLHAEFFHISRHWDGVIFEIVRVLSSSDDVWAKVVGYSKRYRLSPGGAPLGKELRLNLYTHDLYTTSSFGQWYRTHGGNQ